ncbi:MAG TPA: hypothetical protein VFU23_14330 [Gemmatimonadales bacterium]|nr:hypothetical protein [Gemmatimonadales bacterium]
MVPIVAIAAFAAIRIARIKANVMTAGADPQTAARLDAVENELENVRHQLAEAEERIDFTERLLTQQRTDRIEPGK